MADPNETTSIPQAESSPTPTSPAPAAVSEAAPATPAPPAAPDKAQAAAETPAPTSAPAESTPTLLQTVEAPGAAKRKAAEAKASEAKAPEPAEPPKHDEPTPAQSAPTEAPKLEPVEYKYELPETIKLDDERRAALHGALDQFRADPEKGVQRLLDMHAEAMTTYAKEVAEEQRRAFYAYREEQRKAIMADPILGGAGFNTVKQAVARMRDLLVPEEMMKPRTNADGTPRLSELDEFLEYTGAGDHRVLWHILHNAARYLDEPQAAQQPTNIRPPKGHGRAPRGSFYTEESRAKMNGA